MNKRGFTLAEVLITLGIVGTVAALILPVLVEKHLKNVTATRLKAFNSIMAQAFQRAKLEYGDWNNWESNNFGESGSLKGDGEKQLLWLQKYLLPYIKTTETTAKGKYAIVALPNGSGFSNYNSLYFFCVKYSDCQKDVEEYNSRDRFIFQFTSSKGFEPYSSGWKGTREEFFIRNSAGHLCAKGKRQGGLCAKLIEYDGWEIKNDYPW